MTIQVTQNIAGSNTHTVWYKILNVASSDTHAVQYTKECYYGAVSYIVIDCDGLPNHLKLTPPFKLGM